MVVSWGLAREDAGMDLPEPVVPSSRRSLHAPEGQRVGFVELFFDLVFVFAVTQVTSVTAHHLDMTTVGRAVVIFWLIWWAWTQFTWTLNPADTQNIVVQVVTLLATAAAFVMAASVSLAFSGQALWFAVPYVLVRILGLGLQFTYWRLRRTVLVPRLVITVLTAGALVPLIGTRPVWPFTVVAVGLAAITFVERGRLAGSRGHSDA